MKTLIIIIVTLAVGIVAGNACVFTVHIAQAVHQHNIDQALNR